MKTIEVFFTKRDGEIINKQAVRKAFESAPENGRFILKIEAKNKRTCPQNRYLHLMFDLIQKGFYNNGYREVKDAEDAKYILKNMFLKYTIENETGGKIQLVRRTRDLTKEQMSDFIDECVQFAAENLNVVIPPPNTQIMIFQQEEKAI